MEKILVKVGDTEYYITPAKRRPLESYIELLQEATFSKEEDDEPTSDSKRTR